MSGAAPPPEPTERLRHIYAVSDLHAEYEENMQWVDGLDSTNHSRDVLIVAGDVADRLDTFRKTMTRLTARFALVFYIPGNHELWLRRDGSEGEDSLEKMQHLEGICRELGVITSPQRVAIGNGAVHIAPLVSFHHMSFDTEPDVLELRLPSVQRVMADWRACRFPTNLECGSEALALHIDRYNELMLRASVAQAADHPSLSPWRRWGRSGRGAVGTADEPLVTFSHFLPRIELCPEKRFLRYPDLLKAVGSRPLGRRVRTLRPDVHVFGHTHFGWDAKLDGVRYVQAALATPDERRYRMKSLEIGSIHSSPLQLYDGERGAFCQPHHAAWSSYYQSNARTPEHTYPAPWVLDHYKSRAPSRVVLDAGKQPAEQDRHLDDVRGS